MAAVAAAYRGQPVAPLTGFDNGMVLYHGAIVDFFMPFPPNGEGGLSGHWTLGAHYLQLFGPLLFRGRALSLQALSYENTVNLDNLSPAQRRSGRRHEGDLVYHEGVRHPYEYKLNAAYDRFLRSGLKCAGCRFGRALLPADVAGWLPSAATDPATATPLAVLRRLAEFYDPRHLAVRDGLARLLGPGPGPDGVVPGAAARPPNALPPPFTPATAAVVRRVVAEETRLRLAIHIFAYNRPGAFQRMWDALNRAAPPSSRVAIDIFVHHDLDDSGGPAASAHRALLAGLTSHLGPVHVLPASRHRGLRDSVLSAALPTHDDTFVLLLEDDILLSPAALLFAEAALRRCMYGPERDPRLAGVSLYAQIYSEATESFLPGVTGRGTMGAAAAAASDADADAAATRPPAFAGEAGLVAWAMPQSWGALYRGSVWRDFVNYVAMQPKQRYLLPDSYINRWPEDVSWKKALVRFFAERHLTLIYPRLPRRLSFSTNTLAVGANDRVRSGDPRRQAMEDKFLLSLVEQDGADAVIAALLPAANATLPVMTLYGKMESDFERAAEVRRADDGYRNAAAALAALAAAEGAGAADFAAAKAMTIPADHGGSALDSFDRLTVALGVPPGSPPATVAATVHSLCAQALVGYIVVVAAGTPTSLACQSAGAGADAATGETTVTVVAPHEKTAWYLQPRVKAALAQSRYEAVLLAEVGHVPGTTEMAYLFHTWQGHFFNHLVGDVREARSLQAGNAARAFFLPRRLVLRRSLLVSAAALLSQHINLDSDACAPLALAAAAAHGVAADKACPVPVDFGVPPADADADQYDTWRRCAAALLGEGGALRAATAVLSPLKRYGSSTPYAGMSWLKCKAPGVGA